MPQNESGDESPHSKVNSLPQERQTIEDLMNLSPLKVTGIVLTSLVGAVLVLAGLLKLLNLGSEDMIDGLTKANLIQHKTLISITAITCGLLLLVPFTWRFGFLMATAYWGGAIVAHLTYNDSAVMPGTFILLMWMGGMLRGVFGEKEPEFD